MCAAIGGGGLFKSNPTVTVTPPLAPPATAKKQQSNVMRYIPDGTDPGTVEPYGPVGGDVMRGSAPPTLTDPVPPSPPGTGTTLGAGSPGVMSVPGRGKKAKRLDALRSGIFSTIRTSAGGVTGTIPFFAPSASAGGGDKSKLGQ